MRIIILTLLTLGVATGMVVSCGPDSTKQLPCTKDYNCDPATQACYQGFCTSLADIPQTKADGSTGTPDEDDKQDQPAPVDTLAPKDDAPKDDVLADNAPKDEPKALTYPPGPYGADVGDAAIPLALEQCNGKGTMRFSDFYNHSQIKVLLVTVHTGW